MCINKALIWPFFSQFHLHSHLQSILSCFNSSKHMFDSIFSIFGMGIFGQNWEKKI